MGDKTLHTTVGVYNNGDRKVNGVPADELAQHIEYNIAFRPGRALFVDGKCVHSGYLSEERCAALEPIIALIKAEKANYPRH